MKGQVFTIAKLHYINGIVCFTARKNSTDLKTLANNYQETTKSGNVKHPLVRVRHLSRFAEGLGLINIIKGNKVNISILGMRYFKERAKDKWSVSERQKTILREHILENPSRSKTIHAITSLYKLFQDGYKGDEISEKFAAEIGKDDVWKSEVTYIGFTQFGLNYLKELGLIEIDGSEKKALLPGETIIIFSLPISDKVYFQFQNYQKPSLLHGE